MDIFLSVRCNYFYIFHKELNLLKIKKNFCEISGVGLNGFKYKKNLILDAGNSGTLGRLIMGLLTHTKLSIRLKGDKSLSKRDFLRIIKPLKKFGATITSRMNLDKKESPYEANISLYDAFKGTFKSSNNKILII